MAITAWGGTRDLVLSAIEAVGRPLSQISVAEFGNQKIKANPDSGMRRMQSAKGLFEWWGARHVSIDLNGRDGAIVHDLGTLIPADSPILAQGQFDMVTNCGTSEHVVEGQVNVFHNAHNLCKRGGVMAHGIPYEDSPPCFGHGSWKYSIEWFQKLAADNQYEILKLYKADMHEGLPSRNPPGTWYCFALLRKPYRGPFKSDLFVNPKQQ